MESIRRGKSGIRGLGAGLLLAGCAAPGGPPVGTSPGPTPPSAPAPVARPVEIRDTLVIEGMPEERVFHLYQAAAEFPLRFSTYLPDDMRPEREAGARCEAVRFVAHFGGQRTAAAYLAVEVPEEDASDPAVLAGRRAAELGTPEPLSALPRWAAAGQGFRNPGQGPTGSVFAAREDGVPFLVVIHHPPEFGDGMGPRAAKILREWRWSDGRPLPH